MMQSFQEQILRIKTKLAEAKRKDRNLEVFGAASHQYLINKPAGIVEISDFETAFHISLPESYKAFLMEIGNGGASYLNSGAGPYYGIYTLRENMDDLTGYYEKYLSEPVRIYPDMTDDDWNDLIRGIEENDQITTEAFETEKGKIYSGILPLGSQGCTYLHALILNGEHAGRVVNVDQERQKPKFAPDDHFLDWYERWLDEILSGALLEGGATWFGYNVKKY